MKSEETEKYKYLGETLNKQSDVSDRLRPTEGVLLKLLLITNLYLTFHFL